MSMSSASETDEPYPWERPLGARQLDDERAEFRVWAPRAAAPVVKVDGARHAMIDAGLGVWEAIVPAAPGSDYVYVIDGEDLPDPASRWQPEGLRGPSRVLDTRRLARGGAAASTAPALEDLLIYELHIGTFTPEGTFAAAAERLADLADLGVTAVEIMPVAEFPGARGWGYDGVYISAAQSSYGGPTGAGRVRRRGPSPRPGGDPRRRLQPPRRVGRGGDGGLRALLHRQVRDAVGQGDELRRRRVRPGARVGVPERRGLGARLRDRRAAARRHPRDLRLEPRAHRRRGGPARARRQPARTT